MSVPTSKIVNAADREWNHWGSATWNCITGAKSKAGSFHNDDDPAFAKYIIDNYCALFYKAPITYPTATLISGDDYAWSAVFISYVMRNAGFAKKSDFPISESHSTYIRWAIKAKTISDNSSSYWGYQVTDNQAVVEVGDLVCYARKAKSYADAQKFYFKTTPYMSHSDIVVAKRPGEIDVIGGNVRDSVTKKTLSISNTGLLDDRSHNWFAVLKKRI